MKVTYVASGIYKGEVPAGARCACNQVAQILKESLQIEEESLPKEKLSGESKEDITP
jgi:hypothetical protein